MMKHAICTGHGRVSSRIPEFPYFPRLRDVITAHMARNTRLPMTYVYPLLSRVLLPSLSVFVLSSSSFLVLAPSSSPQGNASRCNKHYRSDSAHRPRCRDTRYRLSCSPRFSFSLPARGKCIITSIRDKSARVCKSLSLTVIILSDHRDRLYVGGGGRRERERNRDARPRGRDLWPNGNYNDGSNYNSS